MNTSVEAPLPLALMLGALLGAFGALALGSIELAVIGLISDAFSERWLEILILQAGLGVFGGMAAAADGSVGSRWLIQASMLYTGVWLSTHIVLPTAATYGLPPIVAGLIIIGTSAVCGFLSGRAGLSSAVSNGISAFLCLLLSLLAPFLHLALPVPYAPISVIVTLFLCIPVIGLAALFIVVSGGGSFLRLSACFGSLALSALAIAFIVPPRERMPLAATDQYGPVVIITIHGWRGDTPTAQTPHLNAFSQRAMQWSRASTPGLWTLPATASLFTGRISSEHSAGINIHGGSSRPLRSDIPTLALRYREAGFATAAVVGIPGLEAGSGLDQGFVWYYDRPPDGEPTTLVRFAAPWLLPWRLYADANAISHSAIDFIHAQSHPDWLLWVGYGDLSSITSKDDYLRQLENIDVAFGQLIDALPPHSRIVVAGDHGQIFDERRIEANNAPAGFRSGFSAFEEIVHIPLWIAGPDIAPGVVSDPVSTIDIAHTCAEWIGSDLPGENLFSPTPTRILLSEGARFGSDIQVARRGMFKLIEDRSGWRLYDLERDPFEVEPVVDVSVLNQIHELQLSLPRDDLPQRGAFGPLAEEFQTVLGRIRGRRFANALPQSEPSLALPSP